MMNFITAVLCALSGSLYIADGSYGAAAFMYFFALGNGALSIMPMPRVRRPSGWDANGSPVEGER